MKSFSDIRRFFGRLKTSLVIIPSVLFLSSVACSGGPAPAKVYKAPPFEIVDLNGQKISLAALKGNVVFLDFWATWCPPCVMSVPEVERLVEEYKGKKLVVLSISLDNSDAPVKRFMAAHKMSNRVALAGSSGVDALYNVQGIPAYFIIDQNGNITKAWEGYNPVMTSLWRKEIDRLLAQ